MVLYRVYGMFYAVFMACFVASIGRIWWPVEKGCFGMLSGQNGVYWSFQGALWHVIAWLGSKLGSPCTPLSLQLRMAISFLSELGFARS